jgi:hypothetical protein
VLAGPDSEEWILGDDAELLKLVRTLEVMSPTLRPLTKPTYMKRVLREKWDPVNEVRTRRVRWTVGGDRISVAFEVGTNTAALPTVNALFHACVSEDASFATIDIKDFYLGASLPYPESIVVYLDHNSPALLDSLGITPCLHYDSKGRPFCYFTVTKTMPGLPQSGFYSQKELVELLSSFGYHETPTPMLFRHDSLPISFTLVVDDFAVKYSSPSDLDHLLSCLSSKYDLKTHRAGPTFTYLGYTIEYDRSLHQMTLSMPTYIPNLLKKLRPQGVRHAPSPAVYIPPSYGSRSPQKSPVDTSPPATPDQKLDIQKTCGSLLYYARALDSTFLTAVCALSAQQASPTLSSVAAAERLLGYAASHPSHTAIIRPSTMLLQAAVDASYLSRVNPGSVAGGCFFLGPIPSASDTDPPATYTPNAPLHKFSTRIPVVVASAAEAEYAAIFGGMQVACELRTTLTSLGYPQPPTPVHIDNLCAIGLATMTVRPKMSKSIDMRFDWIIDRVEQQLFTVHKILGTSNLADFFTKILPVARHKFLTPLLLGHPPLPTSKHADA